MTDLSTRSDIHDLVVAFYREVALDDLLGPVFTEVAEVDWSEHIPKLIDFWSRALLGQPGYGGNPFRAHKAVHEQQAFTADHFRRWLDLFEETVTAGWSGPNVDRALTLAREVARVHAGQLIGSPTPMISVGRSGSHS